MKNVVSFLIAGAMFATVAFTQTTDAGAAARFQAKTGREAVAQPKAAQCCGMKMCHMAASSASVSHSAAEQRFFAKNGQYPPSAATSSERPAQAAASETDCAQMGCCKRQS